MSKILPLIDYEQKHFGENKVQEAIDKWTDLKNNNKNIKLHLIGRLQTNKVKPALRIFDYIHSLDSEKLAIKISNEQVKQGKNPKIFSVFRYLCSNWVQSYSHTRPLRNPAIKKRTMLFELLI